MKKLLCTRTVFLIAAILVILIGAGCRQPVDPAEDVAAPTVTALFPDDADSGIAINSAVRATFSEAMDPATIIAANFTLTAGATPVTGVVSYSESSMTATFTPESNLMADTLYTATISVAVKDLAGNAIAEAAVWTFTTGAAVDTTAPTVISTVPIDTTTNVALNGTMNATFSEAMAPESIIAANFTIKEGSSSVTGTVSYDVLTKTASFRPASNLSASKEYTAAIGIGVKDLSGNALVLEVSWHFTTGMQADTVKPAVISTIPSNSATGISIDEPISAVFSEMMDQATFVSANFTLTGATNVAGSVSYDVQNWKAFFTPTNNLAKGTSYTATLTVGLKDLSGNPLVAQKVWTFTTISESIVILGPAPVNLGTAGNFVILAKTAISTVPASIITGDIGLSPAAESYMTGFSQTKNTGFSTCPQVTGYMYAADMTVPTPAKMTTAISDMQTAYVDAAGRATPDHTNLHTGNLGGQTLVPGLYKYSTAVTIPTNVTLSGGANDVWIFQIAQDLTMANAVIMTLSGGAKAKNIYWQVAGFVEIGTTAHFEGNILCMTAITLKTNASMNGRALAQTLVALDKVTITKPAQ